MKKIALLPQGSVSHEALLHLIGDEETVELHHFKHISDVFLQVANGSVDYSVIPIENTIEGSVSLHLDWLVHEVDVPMQVEWLYPSIQNLIGRRSEFMSEESVTQEDAIVRDSHLNYGAVKKVLSHPVAVAQCMQFIRSHMPQAEIEHVGSTAESVEIVKQHAGEGLTAVGTALAAQIHGLDVLAKEITDHNNNYTKFVLIGAKPFVSSKNNIQTKTSMLVTLPEDFAGALHQVLSALAWRRLNLSRIESRPTKKRLGSYYFYMDVLASIDSVLLQSAIEEIQALNCQVRILGSYPTCGYNH